MRERKRTIIKEKEVINLRESMEKGIRVVKRERTRERLEKEKGKMIHYISIKNLKIIKKKRKDFVPYSKFRVRH